MSTIPAANLMNKLSFNLQPTFLSLPWLKRSVVRCFSHKADNPGLPVRYIPKKHRDLKQAGCTSSGDNAPKDMIYTGSSSSNGVSGHKTSRIITHPQGSKIDHEVSNVSSGDAHGLNEGNKHGIIAVDSLETKSIRSGSSLSNGISGHKTSRKISHPQGSRIDHEPSNVSFGDAIGLNDGNKHGNIAVESPETKSVRTSQEVVEFMDVPDEVVQELQFFKRDGQGQGCKLNQENIYHNGAMDSEYVEELEEYDEEVQLDEGIGESKQERSKTCRTRQGVEKTAVELLAKRAFTEVELRKKLVAKNFPVNIVEAVISDFQNRGLINDSLYAEMFSNSRWKSSSWGPRRIKQALVKKGISEGDVGKAVKLVFEDGEDCDLRSSTRLSSSTLQELYVRASKQWQLSQNAPHETRKARIIRWLQYRGFDWAVVSIILKKLESKCSP